MTVRAGAGGTGLTTTLITNPKPTDAALATLPGIFNLVAAAGLNGQIRAVLAANTALSAAYIIAYQPTQLGIIPQPQWDYYADRAIGKPGLTPLPPQVATAVLAGNAALIAGPNQGLAALAVLPGVFNLLATTSAQLAAVAVLLGQFDVLANAANSKPATAVLPGVFALLAAAGLNGQIAATLPGVFNLLADSANIKPASAVLPGIFNLLASSTLIPASSAMRSVQLTDSLTFGYYAPGTVLNAGFLPAPTATTWQGTAVLAAVASLIAGPVQGLAAQAILPGVFDLLALAQNIKQATAVLPGVFNLLAAPASALTLMGQEAEVPPSWPGAYVADIPQQRGGYIFSIAATAWQGTAVLSAIFNLLANPQQGLAAQAILPGVFNLLASADNIKQATAVLPGAFNLVAGTNQQVAALAVLPGVFNLLATAANIKSASAVLSGQFDLLAAPTQGLAALAVLPGVFNLSAIAVAPSASAVLAASTSLIADLRLTQAALATLAGVFNLIATMQQLLAAQAALSGALTILAAPAQGLSARATLPGVFNLVAVESFTSRQSGAICNGSFGLIASMLQRTISGGSSRFTNPAFDYLDPPVQRQQIKRRKKITQPKRPPEASIPVPVVIAPLPPPPAPLPPPTLIARAPQVRRAPAATYRSPIEDQGETIATQIRYAQKGSEVQDALAALQRLMQVEAKKLEPVAATPKTMKDR